MIKDDFIETRFCRALPAGSLVSDDGSDKRIRRTQLAEVVVVVVAFGPHNAFIDGGDCFS